jgi:hypothetical protein
MSSSANDRKRIERRQTITTVIVIVLLLLAVVGLVILITSHFGLSARNLKTLPLLLVFLDSESSEPSMGSSSDVADLHPDYA